MSSEAITRNDLKAVLDEVLPAEPSEYKKLLWTNPSTYTLSATTINLPISDYDVIEIWISAQGTSVPYPFYLDAQSTYSGSIQVPRSEYLGIRDVSNTSTSITFGSGKYYPSYGNYQSTTTQDAVCVPKKIYGVKFQQVAPPQVDASDYVVEHGANYRKWESGTMEQWGAEASASTSNHTVTLPVPFVSNNYIVLGTNTSGTQSNFMTSNTNASYFYVYPVSSTRLFWIAIGRWK